MLGLSRSRVLRILAASRQSGMVQIRVTTKLSHCVALERALETKFGLERAIVIPNPQDAAATNQLIGAALGSYLNDNIPDAAMIGLGWGTHPQRQPAGHRIPRAERHQRDVDAGRPHAGERRQSGRVLLAPGRPAVG